LWGWGAGMGLFNAGFQVVGFDIKPQPNYPFEFILQDALTVDLSRFDAIWASPPCQRYSRMTPNRIKPTYWNSIPPVRNCLENSGKPYIIENVPCSPLRIDLKLNGPMFGMCLLRERWFESNIELHQPLPKPRVGEPLHFGGDAKGRKVARKQELAEDMGIDWMTRAEMGQAVPPVYAEYIGGILMKQLNKLG